MSRYKDGGSDLTSTDPQAELVHKFADLREDNEGSRHDRQNDVYTKQPAQEDEVGRHAGAKVTSEKEKKTCLRPTKHPENHINTWT